MDNSLPIPVTLTSLSIRNLVDVGSLAAPSTMLDLGDLPPGTDLGIPARGSLELRFPLAGASIASEIDVTVTATSPGVASSSVIRSADGLFTTVSGTVEVDELYFVPDEEVFTSKGALDIDVDDVTFNSGEDYVELLSGSLMIEELANEMDLDFKMLQFSLPNFRVAPYGPGDSLVIAFEGTSEDPGYHRYRSLKRTTTRTNIDVDLAGVRIYPTNSQATYNVYGVSESGIPSALDASSKIRASLVPEYLEIATVNASMAPISVAMTDDVDGDDKLELFSDAEANVMDLGSLDSVRELEIDGLQLNGTELTFSIDSNIGADITFYAAMVGIKDDGTQVFLQGRNDLAVSAADTMAAQFLVNGSPIAAENLIAFEIPGTPDANETVTRTIRINNANSNLDAFLSSLPKEMRYVGKGIVQGIGGQRVQLQKPFVLNASLGAGIPVSLAGNARFEDVFEVDLSDLDELTDPDADVTINGASLIISYGNGLPLGLDAAIEVMDAFDETLTSLPGDDADGWILQAASTGSDGTATDATEGTLEFAVSEAQLRAMSAGQKVRLRLTLRTGEGTPATLRASDTLQLSVQGRFDIAVPVNLD